jgi:hypothetical protein
VQGKQKMTPSEAFVETMVANGFRLHGCDGHLRAGRHPSDPGGA